MQDSHIVYHIASSQGTSNAKVENLPEVFLQCVVLGGWNLNMGENAGMVKLLKYVLKSNVVSGISARCMQRELADHLSSFTAMASPPLPTVVVAPLSVATVSCLPSLSAPPNERPTVDAYAALQNPALMATRRSFDSNEGKYFSITQDGWSSTSKKIHFLASSYTASTSLIPMCGE